MLADRPLLAAKLAVPASMLLLGALAGCGASSASSFAVLEQPAGSEHQLPSLQDGVLESLGIDAASARHAGDDLDVAFYVMRAEGRVCLLAHSAQGDPLIGCAEGGVVIEHGDRAYALLPDGEQPPTDSVAISDNVYRL